jgi:hypothetical protein
MSAELHTTQDLGAVLGTLCLVALLYAAAFVAAIIFALVVLIVVDHGSDTGPSAAGVFLTWCGFLLAAVAATAIALRVIGNRVACWRSIAGLAPVVAATGLAAGVALLSMPRSRAYAEVALWSEIAPLRFILAPIVAVVLLQFSWRAPQRSLRIPLLASAAIEIAAIAIVAAVGKWLR